MIRAFSALQVAEQEQLFKALSRKYGLSAVVYFAVTGSNRGARYIHGGFGDPGNREFIASNVPRFDRMKALCLNGRIRPQQDA